MVPELIDARTGSVKWQQSFDNDITDVFEVQSQIATRVAGALGVALGGGEKQEITNRPTANLAAYQLFLKARVSQSVDLPTLRQTASYLEQAVALDSTFSDAWAELSIANTRIYINGAPSADVSRRSKEALDKAIAINPQGAKTHLAAARYYANVVNNLDMADAEMGLALVAAPNDADVLSAAAIADQRHGDTVSALAKLERAREVDPRSFLTLSRLAQLYGYIGRPADAAEAYAAVLLITPTDLTAIQGRVMDLMRAGKTDEARAALRAAMDAGVAAPALAAQFSGRLETAWILDDATRQLVFRLTPTAFDNDRAWWSQALAIAYWQQGDSARARVYADSSLATSRQQAEAAPDDAQLEVLYGLMLALAGHPAEARASATRALALPTNPTLNRIRPYVVLNAARIEIALGNKARAIEYLELLEKESGLRAGDFLTADPIMQSLKGNPRYDALAAKVI